MSRRLSRSAVTLTAIVIMYILCNIPRLVLNLAEHLLTPTDLSPPGCSCSPSPMWFTVLLHLSHFLLTLNSSVNFLIYWSVGNSFKRAFQIQFMSCLTHSQYDDENIATFETSQENLDNSHQPLSMCKLREPPKFVVDTQL